MQTTRVFKNGNSQAVRIPAAIAYPDMEMELEIERIGDELRLRPVRHDLGDVLSIFASFSEEFMQDGRGDQEQSPREAL